MLLVLVPALPMPAQDNQPNIEQTPPEAPRPLPTGLSLTMFSIYTGGDRLRAAGALSPVLDSRLWLVTSGANAEVQWRVGASNQFTATYHVGYNYNDRVSSLNGADHNVSLEFRTDPSRRTVLTLSANGQAGPLNEALFDPTYLRNLTLQSRSIEQLASSVTSEGAIDLGSGPLDLALGGVRYMTGVAHVALSHSHSRRLTSFIHMAAARELRSYSQEELGGGYPNFTSGMIDAGATYSFRPRTSLTMAASYARTYSRAYPSNWQSGAATVERLLSRATFVSLGGGYARLAEPHSTGWGRSTYTASGAIGTRYRDHTWVLTARRGVSNFHGIAADSSVGCEAAWSWAPRSGLWTMGAGGGFERLGGATGVVQGWRGQTTLARRATAHLQIVLAAGYLADSGPYIGDLDRRGARLSVVWAPVPMPAR